MYCNVLLSDLKNVSGKWEYFYFQTVQQVCELLLSLLVLLLALKYIDWTAAIAKALRGRFTLSE